jgi:hypothetical protein
MRTLRFATPTFREAACCASTPPDAFTVTDRRFRRFCLDNWNDGAEFDLNKL